MGLKFLFALIIFSFPKYSNAQELGQLPEKVTLPACEHVLDSVDTAPLYKGGDRGMFKFLSNNLNYPDDAMLGRIEGKVVVKLVVDINGKTVQAQVLKSLSPSLDAEALRVVRLMNEWTPGEQQGEKVCASYILPITFKLDVDSIDPKKQPLYIVDGVIILKDGYDLTEIQKERIESVKFVKPSSKTEMAQLVNLYGDKAENGVAFVQLKKIQKMPHFPGGEIELLKFISHNLQYPMGDAEKGIQGQVVVKFLVDKSGKVISPEIVRGVSPAINKEALRVVSKLPDFIPAEIEGAKVDVYYTMPILFKL
jgi:TonB family C-terminal domain